MKSHITSQLGIGLLSLSMLVSSCSSYDQVRGVATGASLGGMFGSGIGGLMGGPRGADKGTVAGMLVGGVLGAAATSSKEKKQRRSHNETTNQPSRADYDYTTNDDDVYSTTSTRSGYNTSNYSTSSYNAPAVSTNALQALEVTNLRFADENNNRCVDLNEKAYITFDIYNRGDVALYNVAPDITCNNKNIVLSSPTTVDCVQPGQGIRYKANVVAMRKIGTDTPLTFTISFGKGKNRVVAKTARL